LAQIFHFLIGNAACRESENRKPFSFYVELFSVTCFCWD